MKKKLIIFLSILSVILPFHVLAYSNYLIVGGENIGIDVKNNGILIIGFYKINNEYNKNNLKIGDVIKKVNQIEVSSINELTETIEKEQVDNEVTFTIERNKTTKEINFKLIKENNKYKTGLYVKDSITGIGTLTYIDPTTSIYGALGHEILESKTMQSIEVKTGTIFESEITSIDRSSEGNAGTKNAKFNYKNTFGTITKNTESGIYGKYNIELPNKELIEVGNPNEIKTGEAKILTVLEGNQVEEFEINIISIEKNSNIKNIYFEITDKELISKTGGIVQGMSGSPIIQNNKIVGAVTHVIVKEPITGYGIFITTMLEEGER